MKDMPENECPDCGIELCDKHDAEFMARMRELNPPRETHALMRVSVHKAEIQRLQTEVERLHKRLEQQNSLIGLLADDMFFVFNGEEDSEEYFPFQIAINVNDQFYYACADAETVPLDRFDEVRKIHTDHGWDGVLAWVSIRRNREPLKQYRTKSYKRARRQLRKILEKHDLPEGLG